MAKQIDDTRRLFTKASAGEYLASIATMAVELQKYAELLESDEINTLAVLDDELDTILDYVRSSLGR